jgi:hypothetical protein
VYPPSESLADPLRCNQRFNGFYYTGPEEIEGAGIAETAWKLEFDLL